MNEGIFSGLRFFSLLLALSSFLLAFLLRQPVLASEWNDAQSYCNTYGNDAVFHALSEDDGVICFGTKANIATSGTRYKLAGWKAVLKNRQGQVLQTLYFQLDGNYLTLQDVRQAKGYEYHLYQLKLSDLRSRLNQKAKDALESGDCSMTMDACLTVTRNHIPAGSISDDGTITGSIYMDYVSILRAEDWSEEAKNSLKSYFGKTVQGLFFSVILQKGEGITEVEGAGNYLYGTLITISAGCRDQAEFAGWTGSLSESRQSFTVRISQNLTLQANAAVNQPPVLSAGPIYISRSEADAGVITEEWLTDCFAAEDPEDGELQVDLPDYDPSRLTEAEDDKGFPLTVRAVDSKGLITEQEVMIYIMKTEIHRGSEVTGRIRFISSEYFEDEEGKIIPSAQGGLMEDSVWTADQKYRKLLRSILNY